MIKSTRNKLKNMLLSVYTSGKRQRIRMKPSLFSIVRNSENIILIFLSKRDRISIIDLCVIFASCSVPPGTSIH